MGNVRPHVSGSATRPVKPGQPSLRISRMARIGAGFWIGCSPGRLPARLWRDPGAVCLFDPPGSPRRATAGKISPFASICVHLRLKMPVFRPERREPTTDYTDHTDFPPKQSPSVPSVKSVVVFGPEIAIFHRKTAPNGPKTAFSDPFSPARPVVARFR